MVKNKLEGAQIRRVKEGRLLNTQGSESHDTLSAIVPNQNFMVSPERKTMFPIQATDTQ